MGITNLRGSSKWTFVQAAGGVRRVHIAAMGSFARTFSKNRARLSRHRVRREFLEEVGPVGFHLLSDEHFTVDGALIESSASFYLGVVLLA